MTNIIILDKYTSLRSLGVIKLTIKRLERLQFGKESVSIIVMGIAYANMIVAPEQVPLIVGIAFMLFIGLPVLNALIEAGIITFVLRKKITRKRSLFLRATILNLITWPLTFLLGTLCMEFVDVLLRLQNANYMFFLAEVFPYTVEYLILSRILMRWQQQGVATVAVTKKDIFIATTSANTLTFIGAILLVIIANSSSY